MKLTGTFYELSVKLDYADKLVIDNVELVDLLTIIPILDRIKHYDGGREKDIEITIKKVKGMEDAEISDCI